MGSKFSKLRGSKIRLTPCSSQSFLEQGLTVKAAKDEPTKSYPKFLMISQKFYSRAKKKQIYRLVIKINDSQFASVCFGNHAESTTMLFCVNYEKAHRLVTFLEPEFMSIITKNYNTSEFLNLLPLINGNFHFNFGSNTNFELMAQLLNTYWNQIVGLNCPTPELLLGRPVKGFKFLEVFDIRNMGDLRSILRYNVKNLHIHFHRQYITDANERLQEIGRIEALTIHTKTMSTTLPAIKFISRNFQALEKLNVLCQYNYNGTRYTQFHHVINSIYDLRVKYDEFEQELMRLPFKTSLLASVTCTGNAPFLIFCLAIDLLLERKNPPYFQPDAVLKNHYTLVTLTHNTSRMNFSGKFLADLKFPREKGFVNAHAEELICSAFNEIHFLRFRVRNETRHGLFVRLYKTAMHPILKLKVL